MTTLIRKLFFLQLSILFFLIVMHFFPERLSGLIHNRFDLDLEANVPTWYSTVLLFSVSLISLGIYLLSYDHAHSPKFWLVFSCVYCFLSLDEAACIHEIFDSDLHVKWMIVYAPFAFAFFMMCVYRLNWRKNKTSNWIVGGLLIYGLGGMGCEAVSYHFGPLPPYLQQLEFVMEEGGEMLGTIMVLNGCLQELSRLYRSVKITKTSS